MADIKKNVNVNVKTTGAKKAAKELENLNDGIKKTNKGSRTLDRNMKGNSQMSANASKNFSKQAQGMQGVLVPAYAEVAARVFALTAAYGALSKAADFAILMKGQELYAQQTGKNLAQIARSLQEASGYMLDFREASQGAALATTAGLNTDQLKDITKVAKGAAAALGRSLPDAYDRLVRGIVKGEPEILDELGLIIRLDKVYQDFAATLGKNASQLTEYQKLQARQQAVIEKQGLTKFGGIAEQIPANEFERLRASATDLLNTLSTGLTAVFNPIAKFLSEAELALGVIFLMVAKNLATKIFPALEGIGKRFNEIPDNLEKRIGRLNKRIEKSREIGTAQVAAAATNSKMKSNVARLIREQSKVVKPGTTLYRAFGLLENGKLSRRAFNTIKSQWSRIYKGAVKAVGSDGIITRGQLAGQNIRDVEIVNKQMGLLSQRQGKIAAGFRLIGAGAASAFNKTGRAINRLLLGSFQALEGTIKRVIGLAQGLGKVLNKAMMIVGLVQIASFLGDLAFGLSRTFVKAKEAADDFSESTKSALDAIRNTKVDLNLQNIEGSFDKVLASAQFKANIAEQLSTSFNDAIKNLNFKVASVSGGFAKLIDIAKSLFGVGIADALGEGVAQGISALSGTGYQFDEQLIRRFQTRYKDLLPEGTANKLLTGQALTAEESVDFEARATAQGTMFLKEIIISIGDAIKDNQKKAQEFNAAMQAASTSAERMEKALSDLSKSFKVKTSFDDMVSAFDSQVKAIEEMETRFKPEAILKNFGAINPQLKLLQDATEDYALQEAQLVKVRATGNAQAIKDQEKMVEAARKEKNLAKDLALSTLPNINVRSAGVMSLGLDPKVAQEQELLYLEEKERIAKKLAQIESDSLFSIKMQKGLGVQNLENEKAILENKVKSLDKVKGAKRDEQSIKDLRAQIELIESDILIAKADSRAEDAFTYKLLQKEVPLREQILNLIERQRAGEKFTEAEILEQQSSRTLAAAVKYTRQSVLYITDSFKDAIKSVADSFKTAVSDAVVDWVEGTNNADIRATLGKSLTRQGADIAGGVVSEGVFGRTGLLGSAMDALGLGGLADDLIPKTQLEVAREDLKVQREILNELRFQNGLGKLTDGDFIGKAFSMLPFANGGIAKGGFKMYANGGIATQPHVGVLGEGKYNEAIVPLPDGKSIPVMGSTGGATNNVTVNVSVDSNGQGSAEAQGDGGNMKELGYQLSQIVQEELVKQQRPGGLLSSY